MSERQEQAGNGVERLTKSYWLGQDIDTLPRETLMEVIHHLSREVESMRDMLIREREMSRLFARCR